MEKYNYKKFTLCDRVNGYLNLNSGNITTELCSVSLEDLALPLNVAHIHKANGATGSYGKGWQLSLNKQLKLSESDNKLTTIYTYTDELGDTYTVDEKYYVFEGAERVVVDKDKITIDINGNLTYNNKKVYKHQSCNGYTLIPEINDYINSELIRQKQDEEIELEDYIRQQEAALRGYVIANSDNGEEISVLSDLNKSTYEQFVSSLDSNEHAIMITKSKAIKLRSLYKQYNKLSDEDEKALLNEQITEIISSAQNNLPVIKEEFRKYFGKKAEYEQVLLQTPVAYLRDGSGIISGFNKNGNLVLAADSYGNYVGIGYNSENLIASIYDSNNKAVNFENKDGLLQSITDSRGRKVEYAYDTYKRLTRINYHDGKVFTIAYAVNDYISEIVSVKNKRHRFNYSGSKLSSIVTSNMLFSGKTISQLEIEYDSENSVTLTTETGERETYKFNSDNKLIEYTVRDELEREKKQILTYYNNGKTVTIVESSNFDNKPLTKIKEYNNFDLPVSERVSDHWITDNTEESVSTYYLYDSDNKLIRKNTNKTQVIYYYPGDEDPDYINISFSEIYSYDNHGNIILIESFAFGEEQTSGINYEERVYNDDGNMIKCIRWNSLDSSTKFYEEYEREKDGKVKYEKDETGAYSAMYEYADGTNLVNSVTYANGGRTAYGRNPYDNQITSVTASTAEGEANTNNIVYENGLPVKVTSGNTTLEYSYEFKDRKKEVKVNGVTKSTFTYDDTHTYSNATNGCNLGMQTQVYKTGSGDVSIAFERRGTKNSKGVVCKTETLKANGTQLYTITYNEKELVTCKNYKNENNVAKNINYQYDSYDRLTYVSIADNLYESYTYGVRGDLTEKKLTGAVTQTYSYEYKDNAARELDYISFGNYRFKPLSDVNGRNTGREIYNGENKLAGEYITYRKVGDHATNMPATVWFASGTKIADNIKYKYDSCGNISEITQNGFLVSKYTYDTLNRLVREDNKPFNKTVTFRYDSAGNIIERCEYDYTPHEFIPDDETSCIHYSCEYDGDKLVSYNGTACVYNNIGNPTKYKGNVCEWQYGTRLTKYGSTTFVYDGLGRRVKKGGTTFTYDSDGRLIKQSNGLEFFYDANGVAGLKYNGAMYFYRKDAQGNIIAILDSNGNTVASYAYDAWGNHMVIGNDLTIGKLNPFRYRGYYYDTETKLYYLQSRYYDPEVGRFISQDSIEYADPETINGLNLYAYCGNNPVMNVDPTGRFAISLTLLGFIIGAVIGAAVGGAVAGTIAYQNGERGWELFGWTMLGIFGGGLIGGALGAATGAIVTKATGIIGLSITKYSIIPIKSVTVLGNMPGYISAATATGSGYYLISNELWNSLTTDQKWANNMQYIIDANSLGSQFVLVPDKVVEAGSTFWQEIQLLILKGIPWTLF